MFNLGPMELLVIVVVALVVLGPQRLPEAMRQVGKGVAEARRWSASVTSSVQSAFEDEPARSSPPVPTTTASPDPLPSPAPPAVPARTDVPA